MALVRLGEPVNWDNVVLPLHVLSLGWRAGGLPRERFADCGGAHSALVYDLLRRAPSALVDDLRPISFSPAPMGRWRICPKRVSVVIYTLETRS